MTRKDKRGTRGGRWTLAVASHFCQFTLLDVKCRFNFMCSAALDVFQKMTAVILVTLSFCVNVDNSGRHGHTLSLVKPF